MRVLDRVCVCACSFALLCVGVCACIVSFVYLLGVLVVCLVECL